MRRACLFVLLALLACAAVPALAAQQPSPVDQGMRDFDGNTALGAALQMRAGTKAELDELRILADRGPKLAREAVAKSPDSADAQYALGSWLLYGYKAVEVDQISFDAEGNAQIQKVPNVVQGLGDDPTEGLAALKKAVDLAPTNGQYVVDYAAALMDYDQPDEAESILKGVWAGKPDLPLEFKVRAGTLLSTIAEANGDLDGAREWIYSALSLVPVAAPAVDRLREIDDAEIAAAEAAQYAPEAEVEGETEGQPEVVEPQPSAPEESTGEQTGAEQGYQPSDGGEQAPYGGTGQGYQEQPYSGPNEEAPRPGMDNLEPGPGY